jgi:hypothetical protein
LRAEKTKIKVQKPGLLEILLMSREELDRVDWSRIR